jgi:hypothetical protein
MLSRLDEELLSTVGRTLLAEAVQANRITTSIKNRVVNKIYYAGDETQNPGWRSIEPWAYGRNKKGRDVIRAWQREGKSDTPGGNGKDPLRNKPGWRMFRVDRITSYQNATQRFVTDAATASARSYNPQDRDMAAIYYAVDGPGPVAKPPLPPKPPVSPPSPTKPPTAPTKPGVPVPPAAPKPASSIRSAPSSIRPTPATGAIDTRIAG